MIPALVGRSFDVLRTLAAGDGTALLGMTEDPSRARTEVMTWVADGNPRRNAAQAWVDASARSVLARSDGQRGLVRFELSADGPQVTVLVFALSSGVALLADITEMDAAEFEVFGAQV